MAVCGGRGVRTRGFLPTLGGRCVYHTGPWADLPARNPPSLEWQVWDMARASQLIGALRQSPGAGGRDLGTAGGGWVLVLGGEGLALCSTRRAHLMLPTYDTLVAWLVRCSVQHGEGCLAYSRCSVNTSGLNESVMSQNAPAGRPGQAGLSQGGQCDVQSLVPGPGSPGLCAALSLHCWACGARLDSPRLVRGDGPCG